MSITIIGTGGGTPDTLTAEAWRALRDADCIIGARRLLETLPENCTDNRTAAVSVPDILAAVQAADSEDRVVIAMSVAILIGVIGNLDHISYEYTIDGAPHSLNVTTEDADAFFGRSIKDCGKSARVLNELIEITGL